MKIWDAAALMKYQVKRQVMEKRLAVIQEPAGNTAVAAGFKTPKIISKTQ